MQLLSILQFNCYGLYGETGHNILHKLILCALNSKLHIVSNEINIFIVKEFITMNSSVVDFINYKTITIANTCC